MKRSDMVLNIASEIVMQDAHINFGVAQKFAEAILNRIEKDGMLLPTVNFDLNEWESEE